MSAKQNSAIEFYRNNGSSYELAEVYNAGGNLKRVSLDDNFEKLAYSTMGTNTLAICKRINETYQVILSETFS